MTEKEEYRTQHGSVAEADINALIAEKISGGNMLLMDTEKFECSPQKKIEDTSHLLDVRVFTPEKELRIMRPSIADEFTYRLIDDTAGTYDYIDEDQYLDIDAKKSSGTAYVATGGGTYTLPVEHAEKIRIRNYISYDNQGIAQITDFRIVQYLTKGES